MELNNEYAIIVSTTKSYEDALEAFIYFFRKNFDNDITINICSDYKSQKFNNFHNINYISYNGLWSKKILNTLKVISEEYILFFFDDYIIKSKINKSDLNNIFKYIKKKQIDYFKFQHNKRKLVDRNKIDNSNVYFGSIPKDDIYPLPLQTAFWKKNFMISAVENFNCNPWEFEKIYCKKINLNNFKILSIIDNSPINYYDRGLLIKGKIVKSEYIHLKNNGYIFDTSKRNFEPIIQKLLRQSYINKILRYIIKDLLKF